MEIGAMQEIPLVHDVGFPSQCYENAFLPLVNKEDVLTYEGAEYN